MLCATKMAQTGDQQVICDECIVTLSSVTENHVSHALPARIRKDCAQARRVCASSHTVLNSKSFEPGCVVSFVGRA